jgi:hypothetical protein
MPNNSLKNLKVKNYVCPKCGWIRPDGAICLICKKCGCPLEAKVEFEENKETPPHNGACDKVNVCHFVTEKCRSGVPMEEGFDPKKQAVAMSRRWTLCSGYKETLGMIFDRNVGSWVYPNKIVG